MAPAQARKRLKERWRLAGFPIGIALESSAIQA
jgi:hypothetical protein